MKTVRIESIDSYKKKNGITGRLVKGLKPVDDVKYASSAVHQWVMVPDNVEGVYVSRGRDDKGNYFKFWYREV